MFKMPSFIQDTPSYVRTRPGPDPSESGRATPSIAKSVSRDNLVLQSSTARNFSEREDHFHDAHSTMSAVVPARSFDLPEDPSFWKDHNVQVIIRLRPLNNSEISTQGNARCVKQESSQTITWTGHPESRFTFDVVADENVSQEQLFKVAGVPMVENCVAGYNSCMFAYGQTGSGKTHTMLGDIEGGTRRHSVNSGMTPRVFEHLFSRIQKEKEARREEKFRFTCKCSFLEIYNEQILDLLNPSSANLQIREDLKKGIYVENLTELEVASAREVMQQLLQGAMNRKVASTNMNRASSRSHSVFTCVIESTWESQGVTHHRFARLNLVDLAGSERQKSSGAEGERLKEATNINKSLSTLGLVIMNLVSMSNGKSLHVPYRDSKLTFLLQDSLGGNSKTIIIANISPSTGCSLETLSTLKFAQRAKFIKNNAIINEDASGDVLAMRMQIQQLKKEVAQLRGLANGGSGNYDNEGLSMSFLGSPGAFKWEGLAGAFSPLASNRRLSQRKDYEVALVGAFKREKDKDLAIQALTGETKAAMQLAKQREDEIQVLKMRLRFREAGIKRLEAVASGKISAEAHLLKEKEEHLKEIEVLRAQVDRNQEVTRFAMENLHLKEEIRRLKSLSEEGERERMTEQINALQNKLLEALDWKLMHESDPSNFQRQSPGLLADSHSDSDQLIVDKDSATTLPSSIKEENEFLRMQAIQNQAEIDSLRKKLDSYLQEKEKLERHIEELKNGLENVRSRREATDSDSSSLTNDVGKMSFHDQLELKAMVDAIASASQREAEAHEVAITLGKENDELRAKIKVLIDDNSKLIDLYERAVSENKATVGSLDTESGNNEAQQTESDTVSRLEAQHTKTLGDLEHQLAELHEENEKLMSLYEKAMEDRDDLKRMLSSALQNNTEEKRELECPEKLLEIDDGKSSRSTGSCADTSSNMELDEPILSAEVQVFEEAKNSNCVIQDNSGQFSRTSLVEDKTEAVQISVTSIDHQEFVGVSSSMKCPSESSSLELRDKQVSDNHTVNMLSMNNENSSAELEVQDTTFDSTGGSQDLTDTQVNVEAHCESAMMEELVLLRAELDRAREKLSSSSHTIKEFETLEKAILGFDEISAEIEVIKDLIQFKQQEVDRVVTFSSDLQARRATVDNKLKAIKVSLSSITSSIAFFEQREGRAKARFDASVLSFNRKKEKLSHLQAQSDETNSKKIEIQTTEAEIRNNLVCLKAKLEKENQRQENERVLFSIDNIQRNEEPSVQNNWKIGSKATELLKSEEEKTKLQNEIKQSREKLSVMNKDLEALNSRSQTLNDEIQAVSLETQKAAKAVEETEFALQNVINEKAALINMTENGKTEIDTLIAEYQHCIFEDCFRVEELDVLGEDVSSMSLMLDILESEGANIIKTATQLLRGGEHRTALPSEKMRQELEDVQRLIQAVGVAVNVEDY